MKNIQNKYKEAGFTSSTLSILSQDTFVTLLGFGTSVFLARWLGPAQLGVFAVVNLLLGFSEKIGRVGLIDQAALYFLAKEKYPASKIVWTVVWVSMAFALAMAGVIGFYSNAINKYFFEGVLSSSSLWIVVVSIPPVILLVTSNKLQSGLNLISDYNINQLLRPALFLVMSSVFWLQGKGLVELLVVNFLSILIVVLLSWRALFRAVSFDVRFDKNLLGDLFRFNWRAYFVTLLESIQQRIDLALVAFYLSSSEVSFYSLAATISLLLLKLPNALSVRFFPHVAEKDDDKAKEFAARVCRTSFSLLFVGCLIAGIVVDPFVVFFYGANFRPLVLPMIILLPGIIALGTARLLIGYFYGRGLPNVAVFPGAVSTVLNIVANLLFTPQYGIPITAFISTVTYSLYFILIFRRFLGFTGLMWTDVLILKADDVAILRGHLKAFIKKPL